MRTRSSRKQLLLLLASLGLGLLAMHTSENSAGRHRDESTAGSSRCVDVGGRAVRCGSFRRIASGSLLADQLLDAVADADRIVAFSRHGTDRVFAHRLRDRPAVDPNDDPERLLSLRPDLLIVNHFLDPGKRRRLEDSGVVVFDLGPMRGADSFVENLILVARLVGAEERGVRLARGFRRRFDAVASDVPTDARPTGAYVAVYGTQIYGGTRGTSFHDVLLAAGLRDAEAERFEGWPALSSEAILEMDPDHLITSVGRRALICEHPGLGALRACRTRGGIVEVSPGIVDDPGFAMLDTAEEVRAAVHGARREPAR